MKSERLKMVWKFIIYQKNNHNKTKTKSPAQNNNNIKNFAESVLKDQSCLNAWVNF